MIKGAEILEVLHSLPSVRQYLFSLYECRYSVFFQSLGEEPFPRSVLFCRTSLSSPGSERLSLCRSHCGAGDEEGLALCAALPLLRARDEDPGLQPAAGVLPLPHSGLHGRGLRGQHRVHRPVSISIGFVFVSIQCFYVPVN